jgi:uncharacterized protein YutE (UPF0331/DUF86 family)
MILLAVYCEKWVIMTEMPHATEVLEEKYIMLKCKRTKLVERNMYVVYQLIIDVAVMFWKSVQF